ncbi:uncharacterized protein [Drosophila pseudoobscura]|uniref:WAP domain-containing protein n=1 Tax=Drosophila pseudoobscura pseudoobscura TaxID=46245 RepID=A0A6I8VN79_DROPS|nr:uncharacterized protein LOC117183274 [Drosophila pseudoobscura]
MNYIVTTAVLALALGLGLVLIETASSFSLLNRTRVGLFGRRFYVTSVPNTTISTTTTTAKIRNSTSTTMTTALHGRIPKPMKGFGPGWDFDLFPLLTNLTQNDRLEYFIKCVSDGNHCSIAEHCCNKKCLIGSKKCMPSSIAYQVGLVG